MKQIPLRARDGSIRAHALVDDEDEALTRFRWGLHGEGYAARRESRSVGGKCLLLHRVVMRLVPGDGLEVDHRNGDRLDCTRGNLRVVPKIGNRQNITVRRGSSRFRGVSLYRRTGRWQAYVTVNWRRIPLGYFADEVAAAIAAEQARAELMPFALPDPELVAALAEREAIAS